MSTSRWLTWTPVASVIEKTPEFELTKPPQGSFEGFVGATPGTFEKAEPVIESAGVVYLDTACTCDEKPFPHFRHADGTGPGNGRRLEPTNPRQAHGSQR